MNVFNRKKEVVQALDPADLVRIPCVAMQAEENDTGCGQELKKLLVDHVQAGAASLNASDMASFPQNIELPNTVQSVVESYGSCHLQTS